MLKKTITTVVMTAMIFGTQVAPVMATTERSSVATVSQGTKSYAPIKTIVEKMGGTAKRYESDKFYIFEINGKHVRLDDNVAFAQVDQKFVPYETKDFKGYKIPVYQKPIYKESDVFVPVDFLTAILGLKLDATDGQVAFDAVKVDTVQVASNSGSTGVVETNRPTGGTTTPTKPTTPTTPTTQPDKPQEPAKTSTKTYTGSQIKQKLYNLGFTDYNSGLRLNPYGKDGNGSDDYATFNVLSGEKDMALFIYDSDPATDQKFRTMFNWILPNSGGKLYSILDNPNLNSQTITLDGRTVQIVVASTYTKIAFGPIIK